MSIIIHEDREFSTQPEIITEMKRLYKGFMAESPPEWAKILAQMVYLVAHNTLGPWNRKEPE